MSPQLGDVVSRMRWPSQN